MVHGYNLTFASFLLACGSLADLWGRRRVFGGGAALFTVASAVSAAANDILLLDAARALAGFGAAALLTSGSSLIGETFEGRARSRAFGAVGIMTGAGLALGAMAAGAVTDTLGRRLLRDARGTDGTGVVHGAPPAARRGGRPRPSGPPFGREGKHQGLRPTRGGLGRYRHLLRRALPADARHGRGAAVGLGQRRSAGAAGWFGGAAGSVRAGGAAGTVPHAESAAAAQRPVHGAVPDTRSDDLLLRHPAVSAAQLPAGGQRFLQSGGGKHHAADDAADPGDPASGDPVAALGASTERVLAESAVSDGGRGLARPPCWNRG
ncbi:MFS transporter [Streptomyces inhibens]|uniref:MFS transporter n=1 Tax=Streptomyces inhibens TaxID=2293571 RepID=UPI0036C47C83